jgi:cytochrome c
VESPTQADEGAYLYWLNCQPCHGDQGQGLTDEWRAQYPPEDQNCWLSGCHGRQPYENGFTVPTVVPPVTGENSLGRFETMGQVYDFIRTAMPYQAPGSLSDEEYLAITAFLARAHGIWDGTTLTATTIEQFRLSSRIRSTDNEATAGPEPVVEAEDSHGPTPSSAFNAGRFVWSGVVIGLLLLGVWAWRRYGQ